MCVSQFFLIDSALAVFLSVSCNAMQYNVVWCEVYMCRVFEQGTFVDRVDTIHWSYLYCFETARQSGAYKCCPTLPPPPIILYVPFNFYYPTSNKLRRPLAIYYMGHMLLIAPVGPPRKFRCFPTNEFVVACITQLLGHGSFASWAKESYVMRHSEDGRSGWGNLVYISAEESMHY